MSTLTAPAPTASATPMPTQPRARGLFRDTGIVMMRELRPLVRDPFSVIFGLLQPLVFLALFGPLLVGSLGEQAGGLGGSVWQ